MRSLALALTLALLAPPVPRGPVVAQDAPGDTARTTVLFAGRPAGVRKAWTAPDGARHYALEFNDRGRGPALHQRVVLGPDGQPTTALHAHRMSSYDHSPNTCSAFV
jgi:hypothetical protein